MNRCPLKPCFDLKTDLQILHTVFFLGGLIFCNTSSLGLTQILSYNCHIWKASFVHELKKYEAPIIFSSKLAITYLAMHSKDLVMIMNEWIIDSMWTLYLIFWKKYVSHLKGLFSSCEFSNGRFGKKYEHKWYKGMAFLVMNDLRNICFQITFFWKVAFENIAYLWMVSSYHEWIQCANSNSSTFFSPWINPMRPSQNKFYVIIDHFSFMYCFYMPFQNYFCRVVCLILWQ